MKPQNFIHNIILSKIDYWLSGNKGEIKMKNILTELIIKNSKYLPTARISYDIEVQRGKVIVTDTKPLKDISFTEATLTLDRYVNIDIPEIAFREPKALLSIAKVIAKAIDDDIDTNKKEGELIFVGDFNSENHGDMYHFVYGYKFLVL